jgi:hypothetical protein
MDRVARRTIRAGFTLCREHFRIAIRHDPGFGIATKIVGCETVNADSLGILFHRIPDYVACNSSILPSPALRNSSEYFAFSHS